MTTLAARYHDAQDCHAERVFERLFEMRHGQ